MKVKNTLDEEYYDLALFFRLFSDETRLKIIYALAKSELCVKDLTEIVGKSSSVISHQLVSLKQQRVVKQRRIGKYMYYSLVDDHVYSIIKVAEEHRAEEKEV